MPEYTSRPKQKRARVAWDYFMAQYSWMKTTTRTLTLSYSPNLDYYGPGWYMMPSVKDDDTLHWKGSQMTFKALFSTVKNWESENL